MNLNGRKVAVTFTGLTAYPSRSPFDPGERFPEYEGEGTDPGNALYGAVRDTLAAMGLDRERLGTPAWSPFREAILPGMTVFIKPNTVHHHHPEGKDLFSVINHASLLRPILDYVCKALEGKGRIIIGDSQVIYGRFDEAYRLAGITRLLEWYRPRTPIPIECFDLRKVRGARSWLFGRWARPVVEQDPRGYRFVDLGKASAFEGTDPARLRIAVSPRRNMLRHHSAGHHQYLFPASFLESDVVISIPKLKTHRRTAVTLAIKNFMGIPAWKDTLPHFMTGSPAEGGDQYVHPCLRKRIITRLHDEIQSNPFTPVKLLCAILKRCVFETRRWVPFPDPIFEAMWHGNDTLWRTLLDLNRAVIYADREGRLRDTPQRRFFALLDGIIGGERRGPIEVDPVPAGVLLAGDNMVALDLAASTLMGFDPARIPMIDRAIAKSGGPAADHPLYLGEVEEVRVAVGGRELSLAEFRDTYNLRFVPHPDWKGQVER